MPERRGFIMIAVLVVVVGAALVATMLVHFAGSENAVAVASAERSASRALAASGVEVILSELNLERDRILSGMPIELDGQYVLYENDLELGVVRLLPPAGGTDLLHAVGGLLDLNRASAVDLVATGLLDEIAAQAIIAERNTRPDQRFRVLEDLLDVKAADGISVVTPEQLMGPLSEFEPSRDVLAVELDRGERVLEALGDPEVVSLSDVLTVHSFEPALQRSGVLRINLDVPHSEELGRRLDQRFGDGAGAGFKQIMERVSFDDDARIVDVLRFFEPEPGDRWETAFDALSTEDRWHFGRIDLNTAPAAVIQTLEGIDTETAEAIVRERRSLSSDEMATRIWPLLREILTPDTFGPIAGRVTTRTWIWRLRLAAGTVSVDDPDGPIFSPVIFEVTVDLAAPSPRIAELRDISGLEIGLRLYETRMDSIDDPLPAGPEDAGVESNPDDMFLEGEPLFGELDLLADFESDFQDSAFDDEDLPADGGEKPAENPVEGGGSQPSLPSGRWSPR
ncbi:MAG: hypothetical protein P8J45_01200 [Phycisphaerales bacterium]|jgi:hypothetical protein|nr:hypothetical protein [Phycisphaerales bacterium]